MIPNILTSTAVIWITFLHLRYIVSPRTQCTIIVVLLLMHIHFFEASTIYERKESHENKFHGNIISYRKPQLRQYNMKDIVQCFDSLYVRNSRRFHISFIGDSLIRNQFKNFIAVSRHYFWILKKCYSRKPRWRLGPIG